MHFAANRLSNVTFLTSKNLTDEDPSTDSRSSWSTCYYSSVSMGDSYIIQCTNKQTPFTRLFSIMATNVSAIELREVELYRHGKINTVLVYDA